MLRDRLINWAFAMKGYTGPDIPNTCASAERHYLSETGSIWDDQEPDEITPDVLDAELVEKEVCALREDLRSVVKAKYISYPYENDYYCAHRVRMSAKKFKERIDEAHRRLAKKLGE
jgi:hypothetical protein